MTAEAIAKALGGHKVGGTWMARCPAHDDRTPSLAIRDADDGKVLVYCHAGCDQTHVIAALRSHGLWERCDAGNTRATCRLRHAVVHDGQSSCDDAKRTADALRIWQTAKPPAGTILETYLRSRGLSLLPPSTLRFHDSLRHRSGSIWPAMVALVTRGTDETRLAIHRTFLSRDGAGKAPVAPNKMMLGPCRGGAVRLGMPNDVLMVGEGIETCLSAMQAKQVPAWAALSISGLCALDLPAAVRRVIVLADGDDGGDTAARDCALRWTREGRDVRIARPPRGIDFNDLLLGRTASVEEGAV
jgi:hypothetical protein